MDKCYVIRERTEYLTKSLHYDPEFKVLCVHANYDSAVKHFKQIQRQRSNDVEWSEFGNWFSYILHQVHPYEIGIYPREDAKIIVTLERVDYIAD